MTSLNEKVKGILENVREDFNNLPIEERKRISKYLSYMQIFTIWQMLNKDKDITTNSWRDKQREWLKNCVELHLKEWWYE
jgi:hypothetical protein